MKPFRLINEKEFTLLNNQVLNFIQDWAQCYVQKPLEVTLDRCIRIDSAKAYLALYHKTELYGLLDSDYLKLINIALFGQDSEYFDPVSRELFLQVLGSLFGLEITIEEVKNELPYWNYKGSTALSLNWCYLDHQIHMILSPQWAYSRLSLSPVKPINKGGLKQAVKSIPCIVEVQTKSFSLSLVELGKLKIGDLLICEHKLEEPFQLLHRGAQIALAKPGSRDGYKTVIVEN